MTRPRLCSDTKYVFALDVVTMGRWLQNVLGFTGGLSEVPVPYIDLRRDGLSLKVFNSLELEKAGADSNLRPRDYAFAVQGLRELRLELESRGLRCTDIREERPNRDSFSIRDPEDNTWTFWERRRPVKPATPGEAPV